MGASGSFALMPSGISSGNCSIHPQVRKSAFSYPTSPHTSGSSHQEVQAEAGKPIERQRVQFLNLLQGGRKVEVPFLCGWSLLKTPGETTAHIPPHEGRD